MTTERWSGLPAEIVLLIGARDGWTCWCGDGYRPDDPWEIDHDVARANGGGHALSNLRLSHRSCNNAKGAA